MDIKYLTQLNNHQTVNGSMAPGQYDPVTLIPLPISEIEKLEGLYTNGNPFPTSLRELLFLAGNNCYVIATGWNNDQDKMQQKGRAAIADDSQQITRPFYIFDFYNGPGTFLFVYLDEGDDPLVYQVSLYNEPDDDDSFVSPLKLTLSGLINNRLQRILRGVNPF